MSTRATPQASGVESTLITFDAASDAQPAVGGLASVTLTSARGAISSQAQTGRTSARLVKRPALWSVLRIMRVGALWAVLARRW